MSEYAPGERRRQEEANCIPSRNLVIEYIEADPEKRRAFDRARVAAAFFHIHWCQAHGWMCTRLWKSLKLLSSLKNEKDALEYETRDIDLVDYFPAFVRNNPDLMKKIDAEILNLLIRWKNEPADFLHPIVNGTMRLNTTIFKN